MIYFFEMMDGSVYKTTKYGTAKIFLETNRFDVVKTNFFYL